MKSKPPDAIRKREQRQKERAERKAIKVTTNDYKPKRCAKRMKSSRKRATRYNENKESFSGAMVPQKVNFTAHHLNRILANLSTSPGHN